MIEAGHFGAPHAGGVEEFQHRAVTQAEGIGGVGQGEQALDFVESQDFGQVLGLFARQVEVAGRVGRDRTRTAQPSEKPLDAPESGKLGVDDQGRFGARRAVMIEMELIDLERGAGEGGGGCQVLFFGPCQESLERPVMGVERPLRVGAGGEVFEESRGAGWQAVGNDGGCGGRAEATFGPVPHAVEILDSRLAGHGKGVGGNGGGHQHHGDSVPIQCWNRPQSLANVVRIRPVIVTPGSRNSPPTIFSVFSCP